MSKKKKIRVDFKKNRSKPPRDKTWTSEFADHGFDEKATQSDERVRSKGDLSRKRTVNEGGGSGDEADQTRGRILRVHGLQSVVEAEDGKTYRCAVRRVLKTVAMDERGAVATGDIVWFRPSGEEGMIERVEPRHGVLTRGSRKKEHVLVANVDQVVIVVSLIEPILKPHLIDRYLASAARGQLRPIICLSKVDLIDPALMQPLVGSFSQLGITTILTSAVTGAGIERLRRELVDRATVFSGQSGVGKSTILNAIQPDLALRVRSVSEGTQKGRHTTTTAELIKLDFGGWVVDTPGVRTLQLFGVKPGEIEGFFPEFHAFVAMCGFPDCTHLHEQNCAIKRAVARRLISYRRYTSYVGMFEDAMTKMLEDRE
ncbi:MAG: ribosome small subunit-dependent GTPase A [Gemmataceae bacterium]